VDAFQGHAGTLADPCQPEVHDGNGARNLPRADDPVSPAPTEGYVVAFVVFYERGFGVSSHRFLCSLM
jgi:hypothetical protein